MPPAPTPATMPVTASAASADTGIPTSSDRPIAFTTAPGARGCSDMKASDDEHERDERQPERDGGGRRLGTAVGVVDGVADEARRASPRRPGRAAACRR